MAGIKPDGRDHSEVWKDDRGSPLKCASSKEHFNLGKSATKWKKTKIIWIFRFYFGFSHEPLVYFSGENGLLYICEDEPDSRLLQAWEFHLEMKIEFAAIFAITSFCIECNHLCKTYNADHLQLLDVFKAEVGDSTGCPGSKYTGWLVWFGLPAYSLAWLGRTWFAFVQNMVWFGLVCLSRDPRSRVRERMGHPTIIRWLTWTPVSPLIYGDMCDRCGRCHRWHVCRWYHLDTCHLWC